MNDYRARKRILVTGGSGTLGYNILRQLVAADEYQIIAPVRKTSARLAQLSGAVQFPRLDLTDAVHTAQVLERARPDVIVHCAATGLRPPKHLAFDLMRFNVESTMRLFEINCRFEHPCHFISISTGLVYREQGRPLLEADCVEALHPYAASKAASDTVLQAAAVQLERRLTILRPFAFTGLHDAPERLFPLILNAAHTGTALPMTQGTQVRDFCAVDNIARAVRLVIDRQDGALVETFNLGSGESVPLRNLIQRVCGELEINVKLNFGALAMRPHEPMHSVADFGHARAVLGWEPTVPLALAVWELAQDMYPMLKTRKPGS